MSDIPSNNHVVPENILHKLKCSLCKEHLSVVPIFSYSNHGGTGCGRCPVLEDQNPIRNESYEAITQFLKFPCRYKSKGCVEHFSSDKMLDHEETCNFKELFCPFMPLGFCPWQGLSNELYYHYEEQHNALVLQKPVFEVDMINKYEDNYLYLKQEDLFVIHIKCDGRTGSFWCSVRFVGPRKRAQQFMYEVILSKPNGTAITPVGKKPVECDSEMKLDTNKAVYIDTEDIAQMLENPISVLCTLSITQNLKSSNCDSICEENMKNMTICDGLDENLLQDLECPICSEFMVPPIHQCVRGHSICGQCKPKVSECPTCREPVQDTRNFALEKMVKYIKYHCKFRDYGCMHICSADDIKKHEERCKFGPYSCPLKDFLEPSSCNWKGKLDDVITHAEAVHEDQVLHTEIISTLIEDDDTDCFLFRAHDEIFKLSYSYRNLYFYWTVQLVGPSEEANKYMFELDFIDQTNENQRIFVRKGCSPLTSCTNDFEDNKQYLYLPYDLVQPLCQGDDVTYRIRIVEKDVL